MTRTLLYLLAAAIALPQSLHAEEDSRPRTAADDALSSTVLEAVTVVGSSDQSLKAAGSSVVIDGETLEKSRVLTTNEALRKAGVNVRDEEGLGLRPNIGIRGQNPTRSTKTLLLEDGIPFAYGSYGDNASYYHPPVERFDRIEVLKGTAQALYGPQTISGLVNYITPAPTQSLSGGLTLAGGEQNYLNTHGYVSGRGLRLDVLRKKADGARDNIDSDLTDFSAKGVFDLAPGHRLTARASRYREDSNITYSGITDAELQNFGRSYNPFSNDTFDATRSGASLTHEWMLTTKAVLKTNLYTAYFSRDWWRQSSTTSDGQCGAAFTTARNNGMAVDPNSCNSAQGRLRDYRTTGVEPRLSVSHSLFGLPQDLIVGARAHFETQQRVQKNGTTPTARDGTVVERNRREADAYAYFAQNTVQFGALSVTPGIRIENVNYRRKNQLPNGLAGETDFTETLPSLALSYALSGKTSLFAGVHKGFAPPATADLIDNNGATVAELESERSINAELGIRSTALPGIRLELVAFRNDFDNQIVVGSIAGGSTPLAQGKTLYEGLELNGRVDLARVLALPGRFKPFVELAWTSLPTADAQTAFTRVDNGQAVAGSADGRRLPYAPEQLVTATLGAEVGLIEARFEAVYIGEQFADFANTETPIANGNGQIGKISDSLVYNAALNASLPGYENITVFVAAKNLTDETDIVDRTRGIQLNQPRIVLGGVNLKF